MRIIGQAVRAVLVEMIGVIAVLWLLFGTAAWTVDSYRQHRARPVASLGVWEVFAPLGEVGSNIFGRGPSAVQQPEAVAERLDHYSRVYRSAAEDYLAKAMPPQGWE